MFAHSAYNGGGWDIDWMAFYIIGLIILVIIGITLMAIFAEEFEFEGEITPRLVVTAVVGVIAWPITLPAYLLLALWFNSWGLWLVSDDE
jgi:RsiW-degrading membrane proteinase PrsW (M82 family)